MERLVGERLAQWSLKSLAEHAAGASRAMPEAKRAGSIFIQRQTQLCLAQQWQTLDQLERNHTATKAAVGELKSLLEDLALGKLLTAPIETLSEENLASSLRSVSQQIEETTFRSLRALRLLCFEAKHAPSLRICISPSLDRLARLQMSATVLLSHFCAPHSSCQADTNPDQLAQKLDLEALCWQAVEYTSGFCIEKHGVSPKINIVRADVSVVGVPAFLKYIVSEILKNSMQATITAFDHDIDAIESSVVELRTSIDRSGAVAGIRVSDQAGGVSWRALPHHPTVFDEHRSHVFHHFYTTVEPLPETYTYGGGFGVPFSGEGVGLSLARQYARFHGGDLQVNSLPGHGTDVHVYLDARGISTNRLM